MMQPRSPFHALGRRLMLSYLAIMGTILALAAIAVYQRFSLSVYQQVDERLLSLADAAAQTLPDLEREYREHVLGANGDSAEDGADHDDDNSYPEKDQDKKQLISLPLALAVSQDDRTLLWQSFRGPQGAQWFDAQGQLLHQIGALLPSGPVMPTRKLRIRTVADMRLLTLPVYQSKDNRSPAELIGFVQVSESTEPVQHLLANLRWGLGVGGALALALTAGGGFWLTRQSLRPVEQSFRQLQQFTADASHELRSPLTAIRTSVEVMQSHPERIHAADVQKLAAIASATRQMSRLVDDLLVLTRMDARASLTSRESQQIPLDELLSEMIDGVELQAEQKAIAIVSQLQPGLIMQGDGAQMSRLVDNLLQNALTYTPSGGKITVSLSRSDRFALLRVDDTGIGIASTDLPFVFDRFWRADPARSYRDDGMGLGLAIAQSIARDHGGEISVTSQLGKGSCFTVRLPLFS